MLLFDVISIFEPIQCPLHNIFIFLQAISQYCRYYHQTKPFSHIIIDLFKDTVTNIQNKKTLGRDEAKRKANILTNVAPKDDHRSDTDSGRSSINADKELVYSLPTKSNQLRVKRDNDVNSNRDPTPKQSNVYTIGEMNNGHENIDVVKHAPAKLQVLRRKEGPSRRRNMQRRNTIDVNRFDIMQASADNRFNELTSSKSINGLDRVDNKNSNDLNVFMERINQINLNGSSMPSNYAFLFFHNFQFEVELIGVRFSVIFFLCSHHRFE